MIAIGLMSGTSLDGVDAALVRLQPHGERYVCELLAFETAPFESNLQTRLAAAVAPGHPSPAEIVDLDRDIAVALGRCARRVRGATPIDYVASHGLTLYHDGARHRTMQLGDPFVLREMLDTTVVSDFRRADCATGGQGAPLVPYVDALMLTDEREDRVALNLGGIANLTALPARTDMHGIVAFDTGPGMMLIDAFVRARSGGEHRYDRDGALAARGTVNDRLLDAMMGDAYFSTPLPKSTGRERFGDGFVRQHERALGALSLEDGAATLTALTARSVAEAISGVGMTSARVIASGGGARNLTLLEMLRVRLSSGHVEPSDAYGFPVDAKEAMAFAILGYETLRERASNLPSVTGAARGVTLGSIAPSGLAALLAELQRECPSL